ncbi:hypothetical protein Taro_010215 [Colocasia esculenta]|uniref:Uncharacterized protein n=1 Tax=Colocasia esculenta TaxID=4460 RepID=A0A843U2M7_COLES|nr:hypothetical protein [Colocasia esculenta]
MEDESSSGGFEELVASSSSSLSLLLPLLLSRLAATGLSLSALTWKICDGSVRSLLPAMATARIVVRGFEGEGLSFDVLYSTSREE